MTITYKPETTMLAAANKKGFAVYRDGQLIGWAYFHETNGWRCVSNGRRVRMYCWPTKDEASAWLDKMKP